MGPLLVLAGAGSGKTRVITQKIAYLLEKCEMDPRHVVALTFTNKAANEMKQRVAAVLPASVRKGLTVSTFHNLGLVIIKRELLHCGLKAGFSIFDSDDSLRLIQSLLPQAQMLDRGCLRQIQQQISFWKNELLAPDAIAPMLEGDQPPWGIASQRIVSPLPTSLANL